MSPLALFDPGVEVETITFPLFAVSPVPLETRTVPPIPVSVEPPVIDTSPPVTGPEPPLMSMLPPFVFVLGPAFSVRVPPVEAAAPRLTVTAPEIPPVLSDVVIEILPVSPPTELPVDSVMLPLVSADLVFALAMEIDPVFPLLLAPLEILTSPPAVVPLPAINVKAPPTPSPEEIIILPLCPFAAFAVDIYTPPDVSPLAIPVDNVKEPLIWLDPDAAVAITILPLLTDVPLPLVI
ncbi:hypothetical protein PHMEG_0002005 [Phytophthora megakarya]|uniref:Uncharacterized protein n=1 Tax=Phytophthora megakarya TaxID=4795 RepID=A0A225X1P4_9STRA|nr:hypothetical protein PHMEG_0002005 [Phytophthora megakarya]